MIVGAKRGIIFDYEIDVGQVKTARGDICTEEYTWVWGARKSGERGGAEGLGEGAMEFVDSQVWIILRGGKGWGWGDGWKKEGEGLGGGFY